MATITKHWREDPTCPLPAGAAPIPKAPLIHWAKTKPGPGRPPLEDAPKPGVPLTARQRIEEAKARIAETKMDGLLHQVLNAEEARAGLVAACNELKRELLEEIPAAAWAACQGKQLEEATAGIRELQAAALNRFAATAGAALT